MIDIRSFEPQSGARHDNSGGPSLPLDSRDLVVIGQAMVEDHMPDMPDMPGDEFREEVRRFLAAAMTPDLRAASVRQIGLYSEPSISRQWHRILYEKGWI